MDSLKSCLWIPTKRTGIGTNSGFEGERVARVLFVVVVVVVVVFVFMFFDFDYDCINCEELCVWFCGFCLCFVCCCCLLLLVFVVVVCCVELPMPVITYRIIEKKKKTWRWAIGNRWIWNLS